MPTDDDTNHQHQRTRPLTSKSTYGSTAAILIVATLVFLFVNGPLSHATSGEILTKEPTLSGTAILGEVKRHSTASAFRGADASAFMGGVELDFRDTTMEGSEARVDVSAIMGGVDIRVPRTWTVVNRVTPIMGGVEDRTNSGDGTKRLLLEGTVLMGGLKISN